MTGKKEKTQKRTTDTALRLFSSLGYNATTTALIASEAGISEAIIFKYFKNKEGLLKAISTNAIDEIIDNISLIPFMKNVENSKEYPLAQFLKSIIVERLEFFEKNFELVKLLLIEMQYSDNLKFQVKTILFPKAFQVFEAVNKILITKAEISKTRSFAMLKIILGIIESYALQKYIFDIPITDEELHSEVDEIISILQKGCI